MIINRKNILKYAEAYDQGYRCTDGEKVEVKMKLLLKRQRFLKKKELVEIGKWKSKRPVKHYRSEENDDLTVKEITKFSFNTESERARIKSLLALKGISWPVASSILHFAFPEKYPIMDFRVVWSLGWNQPSSHNFSFWQKYCTRISRLSKRYRLPIKNSGKSTLEIFKISPGKIKQGLTHSEG